MKTIKMIAGIIGLLLFFWLVFPVRGQSGIIIDNADSETILSVGFNSGLGDVLLNISDRIFVHPANSIQSYDLTPIPTELVNLTNQVSDRFMLLAANSAYVYTLAYPTALANDVVDPQLSQINAAIINGNVQISWITDEWATSRIEYGLQSGQYSQIAEDELYAKIHTITLTGLSAGKTYYYRITCTDHSNNFAQSSENSFSIERSKTIYLPFIYK